MRAFDCDLQNIYKGELKSFGMSASRSSTAPTPSSSSISRRHGAGFFAQSEGAFLKTRIF
jgi:hypothetical protein